MAEFKQDGIKVRCIDCVHLEGNKCLPKREVVASRKRRKCSVYSFKGKLDNRTPLPGIYFPTVDKKTQKVINNLLKMGIIPVREDGRSVVDSHGKLYQNTLLEMPQSTATVSLRNPELNDRGQLVAPQLEEQKKE